VDDRIKFVTTGCTATERDTYGDYLCTSGTEGNFDLLRKEVEMGCRAAPSSASPAGIEGN
jgi:hypothetical protein